MAKRHIDIKGVVTLENGERVRMARPVRREVMRLRLRREAGRSISYANLDRVIERAGSVARGTKPHERRWWVNGRPIALSDLGGAR